MTAYLIVFTIVWLSAFADYVFKNKFAFYVAIIVTYFFTAFRFETGHDWPIYLQIFESTKPIFSSSLQDLILTSKAYNKEFAFILYNAVLKQIWGEFQVIIVITTSLYYYSFFKFLKTVKAPRTAVFAASYSWLVFSLYFSTLSQSLAISFFLLFWVSQIKQQNRWGIVWALTAILFQVSALMYFAIYFLAKKTPPKKFLLFTWLALLVIVITRIDLAGAIIEVILSATSNIGLSNISNKIHYYLFERGLILNTFDIAFVILFTIVFGAWFLYKKNIMDNIIHKELYGFSIYFILFQGLFINHVVFRYRLLYVAFPILFIVIYSSYRHSKTAIRFWVLLISFIISMTYGTLYLNKPSSITFIPYQNYIYLQLFGDLNISTGQERTKDAIDNTIRQN